MKKPSRSRNGPTSPAPSNAPRYNLRVIGGIHRSRKLVFAEAEGLRPTPDRVRETLFNWLAPIIEGANCLDAFAGSGALGIEALSRGAGHVDFIETNRAAADAIAANLHTLRCDNASVLRSDTIQYLQTTPARHYDIVFCDPPFHTPLLTQALDALLAQGWLGTNAMIYIEAARDDAVPLPAAWQWHRHQQAGNVQYGLLRRS